MAGGDLLPAATETLPVPSSPPRSLCSGPAHGPGGILSCLRGCSGDETNPVIRVLASSFLFWTQVHEYIEGHGRTLVCAQVSIAFLPEA
jgi:hypothetical protein